MIPTVGGREQCLSGSSNYENLWTNSMYPDIWFFIFIANVFHITAETFENLYADINW